MRRLKRTVYINGRFLSQRLTGVQRFAYEIVKAIDHQLARDSSNQNSAEWFVVAPPRIEQDLNLKHIRVRRVGPGKGHFWDQATLPLFARDGVLINLANTGPLLHPRSLTIIHDAAVFRTPQNYSRPYRILHKILGHGLARRSHLGTVSAFSQKELAEVLHLDASSIFILPNGGEHISAVAPDSAIITKLGLTPNRYFLFVGSPSPNKNLHRAMEAFVRLKQVSHKFVVVGSAKQGIFRSSTTDAPLGVVLCGPASDAEIAALYRNASALVFPSLYEGFGIPPLEAMEHGCAVLASDIPPVREVCGESATYFSPYDVDTIARAYQRVIDGEAEVRDAVERGRERCKHFSWASSAQHLIGIAEALI